jgi:hypothetical protein
VRLVDGGSGYTDLSKGLAQAWGAWAPGPPPTPRPIPPHDKTTAETTAALQPTGSDIQRRQEPAVSPRVCLSAPLAGYLAPSGLRDEGRAQATARVSEFNTSGIVRAIALTRNGSGYQVPGTAAWNDTKGLLKVTVAPPQSGGRCARGEAVVGADGALVGIRLVDPGQGYTEV